jgi:hypothetical protein
VAKISSAIHAPRSVQIPGQSALPEEKGDKSLLVVRMALLVSKAWSQSHPPMGLPLARRVLLLYRLMLH